MKRSKKMVLLSNCLLNVNAKVEGLANYKSGLIELIEEIYKSGYGIIQLPCIEQDMCGIKRWGQVYEQLNHPQFRERCYERLLPIVQQVEDFIENGYEIAAVIGINGSPSCGVEYTCSSNWGGEYSSDKQYEEVIDLDKKGVMMKVLDDMFKVKEISIPFIGIDEKDPERDLNNIINILKGGKVNESS